MCVLVSLKDPGSSATVEPEGPVNPPTDSGSPKRHFQEGAKEEQVSCRTDVSACRHCNFPFTAWDINMC